MAEITFIPMTDLQIALLRPDQVAMWVRDCERFRDENLRYRRALKEIASEDYRGPRPQSAVTAYYALHPDKKP